MLPDYSLEIQYSGVIAGIDEAGRGPWAGPVVAAAVIMNQNNIISGINDSKKLSKLKREEIFDIIIRENHFGIGISSVEEIDEHNILGATKIAMLRAYNNLPIKPDFVLIDGNQLPNLPCKMKAVIGGDAISISIAAASIVAKVTRDRMMNELSIEFPYYGWEKNSGYGTKLHQEGINKHGINQHHRRSFAPIKKIIDSI